MSPKAVIPPTGQGPTPTGATVSTRQPLPEAQQLKPTTRLEPVAQALLARGWTQTRRSTPGTAFGPTKDGYAAVFAEPLDLAWIDEHFLLPASVRYDADRDELFDTETYTSIRGSSPEGRA